MPDKNSWWSPHTVIATGAICNLFSSMFLDVSIAHFFGATRSVDLFFAFFGIFESSQIFCRQTEGGILPHLNSVLENDIPGIFRKVSRQWVGFTALLIAALAALLSFILGSKGAPISESLFYGISVTLAVCLLLACGFYCTYSIWRGRWFWYAFQIPIIRGLWTILLILAVLLGYRRFGLPVGLILACMIILGAQVIEQRRFESPPLPALRPPESSVIRKIHNSLLLIAFETLLTIGVMRLMERVAVYRLGEGVVTSLAFATRLSIVPQAILLPMFSIPLFAQIAQAKTGDWSKLIGSTMRKALLIITLAYGIFIPFLPAAARVLFGHGRFPEEALQITSYSSILYSLSFLGTLLTVMLGRVLWAMRENWLRVRLQAVSTSIYVVTLSTMLWAGYGYVAAPIAWTVFWSVNGLLHLVVACRMGILRLTWSDGLWAAKCLGLGLFLLYIGSWLLKNLVTTFGFWPGLIATAGVLGFSVLGLLFALLGKELIMMFKTLEKETRPTKARR